MLQDSSGIDLIVQVDRRAHSLGSLFSEMAGADESMIKLRLSNSELQDQSFVERQLTSIVERYS